jgi:putative flippase GtrA
LEIFSRARSPPPPARPGNDRGGWGVVLPMRQKHAYEILTAMKFGAVGCIGLGVDIALLQVGLAAGASPLLARIVSLACAMQATFLINGLLVFRCLDRERCVRQWLGYMGSNGVGNACNYLIFAGLLVGGAPVVSQHYIAFLIGSLAAYAINYAGVRLLAFGRPRGRRTLRASLCDPDAEAVAPIAQFEG